MNFQKVPIKKSSRFRAGLFSLAGVMRRSISLRVARFWIFLFLGMAAPDLCPRDGRSLFDEAYRIEKAQPERAAGLYRAALESGLPLELGKAARWRLFFLCRDQGWYIEAYELLLALSHKDSIEESLLDDVRSQWGLKRDEFLGLVKACRNLRKGKSPSEHDLVGLRTAYNAGTNRLKGELDRWLKDQGREAVLIQLAAGNRNLSEVESAIRTASYWIDRNDAARARLALEPQLTAGSLSREDRARVLYLFGRMERLSEETAGSAVFFRLASNYASGAEKNRMIALAAFTLYREGQSEQAWELTRALKGGTVEDEGMRLFLTVLEADLKQDNASIARLRAQEKTLRRQERSFLTAKALEILRLHPIE